MPKTALKKEKWTLSFDPAITRRLPLVTRNYKHYKKIKELEEFYEKH